MNQTTTPDSPPQKAGIMVRLFLIALPVGLAFMVPLSLWIYYQKKHRPAPTTSQFAAILRKDVDAADFARYARILSTDVGERTLAKPDNIDAATAFIESTMGYDNMGYVIARQSFDSKGAAGVNLVAELTGQSRPEDVILVVAAFDEPGATAVAALMCAAHALAGTQHARTIRFAAILERGGGLPVALQRVTDDGRQMLKLIHVGPLPSDAPSNAEPFLLGPTDPATDPVPRLKELVALIEHSADE